MVQVENAIKTVFAAFVLPGKGAKKIGFQKHFRWEQCDLPANPCRRLFASSSHCRHFYLVTGINGTSPN
jgi:hypothetical protein